jgi:coenzyme F420 hydrogenase subunit beta
MLFGRHRKEEEVSGIYRSLQVARATETKVIERAQDGGVASAIVLDALASGAIEGAVLTGIDPNQPWCPLPMIAKTREEVLKCAGTKYCYSPIFQALKQSLDQGLKHIAFVGTPCQILAVRRMQKANLRKLVDPIVFSVGLFCSESFSYQGLMVEKIQKGLGVDLHNVEKLNIKGRMQVSLKDGKTLEIPLKEARTYAQASCRFCEDFSSEFADISLGGVGLGGWTFTAVRTEQGQCFYDAAVSKNVLEVRAAKEFQSALDLLVRLSVSKRRNALKSM